MAAASAVTVGRRLSKSHKIITARRVAGDRSLWRFDIRGGTEFRRRTSRRAGQRKRERTARPGVKSLRTRRRSVWTMLIVPALFTATGLFLLVLRPSGDIPPMAAWLVGLMAFAPLGLVTGRRILAVDRASGRVTLAGSPVSLVRNLFGFRHPVWNCRHPLSSPGGAGEPRRCWHAVSGTSVGYFIGWTIAFWRRYRAPQDAAGSALEPDLASIA
jgi:hypothetical protein